MKKITLLTVSCLLFGVFGFSATVCAAEKTIKLASWGPAKHYSATLRAEWIKEVNSKLKGTCQITEFPNGKLYGPKDVQNAVSKGIVDMGLVLQSRVLEMVPMLQGAYMPFGFETLEEYAEAYSGESMQILSTALEQKGLKLIWVTFLDPVHIFSNKKNYHTVEELKGLKVLTISPIASEIFSNLGCAPNSSIPQTEQFIALQKGISNATLTTTVFGYFQQTFKAAPYVTKINFSFPALYIMMNTKKWKALSPEAQDAMMDIGQTYSAKTIEMANAWSEKFSNILTEQGATITDFPAAERKKIVTIARKSWTKWAAENGPNAKRLYQINLE